MSPLEINMTEMFDRVHYHIAVAMKRHYVRRQDVEDLVQDIIHALFRRAKSFDPRRAAWSTFINVVIEVEIKRFRQQKRWRKYQTLVCLHDLEEEEHPPTNFYPTYELNDLERFVFFGEIRSVIEELPEELQEVCQLLPLCSKIQTAERLKIGTATLTRQIEKIRLHFSESKIIQDFLNNL